jgi:hypothetical protein
VVSQVRKRGRKTTLKAIWQHNKREGNSSTT